MVCGPNLRCEELTRCIISHSLPCNMPGKSRPKALTFDWKHILNPIILCDVCWENRLKIYRTIEGLDMSQFEETLV